MDKKKPSRIDVIGSNTNDGFHYFCGNCVNKDSELCGECFREGFVDYGIDKEPLHYKRSIKPIIRDTAEDAMQDAMLYGIGLHYLDVKRQMMEENDRYKEYLICKERGHTPSGYTLACNPPLNVCKFCGAQYRYENKLLELNIPEPPTE